PKLSNSLLWKHHVILPEVKAQKTKAFVEMNNSCLLGMYRKFEITLKNFFSCLIGLFSLSLRFTENNRVIRKTYNRKSLLIHFPVEFIQINVCKKCGKDYALRRADCSVIELIIFHDTYL